LTDKEKTKAWLFAIARHVFLDEIRRRTIRRRELFQDTDADLHTPEGDLVAAETAGALWREVDALPPPKPEILALRFRGGLDLNEIATVLELPLGTVKVHLFRARADLRTTLGRFEEK
jgi:RNA polymerase sigma-70 factor (ECF subfamily)